MQAFVDRFRATASKARQAQSRMKMIAKLQAAPSVVEEHVAPFLLPSPARPLAPPLVRLEGVSVGYGGPPILKGLNLRLDLDDRIGLLGVNGSGKSTFAKMIAGDLPIHDGHLHRDRRIKVGWFHQHQIEALDPNDTPLDIIRRVLPEATEAQRRSHLARFGMTVQKVETTVANLSGGERARLLLNLVAMERAPSADPRRAHQPPRHRQPARAHRGAQRLRGRGHPDHPRPLADGAGRRSTVDGRRRHGEAVRRRHGRLRPLRPRPRQGRGARAGQGAAPTPAPAAGGAPASAPLKRKLEAAEDTLARETRLMAQIDADLADPALYSKGQAAVSDLTKRRQRLAERLAQAEQEWIAAAERYEASLPEGQPS